MKRARRLLVLDTAFALEAIRTRGLEDSITCRDLGGFFEHVWSVHPFATLVTSETWTDKFGKPEYHDIAPGHTFIDGKMGRFAILRKFPGLNFLIGQIAIFRQLRKLVSRQGIDVIRAGDPLYLGVFGLLLARICGVPLVLRIGANYDKIFETTGRPAQPRLFFSRRVEKVVERFVLSRADLVAGANQDNLDFAIENGAQIDRTTLFRYGNLIDKRHFKEPGTRGDCQRELAAFGLEPRKFLLYIGRLEKVKHPDDVIRVLAEVRRRGHEVKAALVGDGGMRPSLVALAKDLGVCEHVIFCGNQNQGWLSAVIPKAAVVVSPHTGRALSEAALGAAPIVAYDLDWQRELISTEITGELVRHNDWAAMADAADRYLTDTEYATRMGGAVRERALRILSPETLDQHEREQYALLLNRFEFARSKRRSQKSETTGTDTSRVG